MTSSSLTHKHRATQPVPAAERPTATRAHRAPRTTDLPIDFSRFINLRKKLQTDYLAGKKESISCTGADSAIIAASPLPVGVVTHRFAACDDSYIVYPIDPAVTAPNLAAVQELAVGFIRVGAAGGYGAPGLTSSTRVVTLAQPATSAKRSAAASRCGTCIFMMLPSA